MNYEVKTSLLSQLNVLLKSFEFLLVLAAFEIVRVRKCRALIQCCQIVTLLHVIDIFEYLLSL